MALHLELNNSSLYTHVYIYNKFVHVATPWSSGFHGYFWCDKCWPQLRSPVVQLMLPRKNIKNPICPNYFMKLRRQIMPLLMNHRRENQFKPQAGGNRRTIWAAEWNDDFYEDTLRFASDGATDDSPPAYHRDCISQQLYVFSPPVATHMLPVTKRRYEG